MTTFLTSSPTGPLGVPCSVPGLDNSNGFVELLARRWKPDSRCLMIAASPGPSPNPSSPKRLSPTGISM